MKQSMCHMCAKIKHNSFYKTLTHASIATEMSANFKKFKRESYMDVEEIKGKLANERKRRQNAEVREKRVHQKIESSMLCFDENDNKDFNAMFHLIDENKVSDDMKLFYHAQQENLGKKSVFVKS